jgi:glyoxylase-like metal-dependent hydrolase (beta-lactamase superfamily II)
VKDRSLEGARYLEGVYQREGKITKDNLPKRRYWKFWLVIFLLLVLLAAAGVAGWFYCSYVRLTEASLAPGVDVVLAGGGNSLLVRDGPDLMVVDTKFPPGSDWFQKRISKIGAPVTIVVDTHYHYDHTQGNTNYSGAKIYAYKTVPDLMRKRDGDWWNSHQSGIPTELVDAPRTIKVGAQDVVLTHPGPAHTQGDLYVYLRRGDKEIVATGDLLFNTYYPFMDLGEGGEDILGLISAVRTLSARYPNAVFVPGHGPLANAADLVRYADYLQFLNDSVAQARQKGLSEDQAVSSIDLSKWNLSRLPSFHGGHLCWATAETNIRWVYQIQAGTRQERKDCTF